MTHLFLDSSVATHPRRGVVDKKSQKNGGVEQEAALVDPVDLFRSPHNWSKYHNDLKIFIECCLAHAKNGLPAQILITNDHKSLSMFLRSSLAEDTLHSVVTDVFGVQEGVRVKLLGEIVHGWLVRAQ